MGRKTIKLALGAILAVLLISILPISVLASPQSMSAVGTITYISGTDGYATGNSGNYKVTSRTVTGTFISGDLSGDYSFTYQANIDLNTQSGTINGDLTNGDLLFDIQGKSYPFTPIDQYTLYASANGTWEGHGWSGGGTWTANYYFHLDDYGHIESILPNSSFNISGQWNLR